MCVISSKIIGFIVICGLVAAQAQDAVIRSQGGLLVETQAGNIAIQANANDGEGYSSTGVLGSANGASYNMGVQGFSSSYGDYHINYGLFGEAYSGSEGAVNTGVYATAGAWGYGSQAWAGYFDGDVYVSGYFSNPSDSAFKKDVQPLQNGLSGVLALKPSTYEMRSEEFKDRVKLPKGRQVGLIAQEVEKVFPDLVRESRLPGNPSKDSASAARAPRDTAKFKSIDYLALIPILVKAVQEQHAVMQEQAAQIAALRERIENAGDSH